MILYNVNLMNSNNVNSILSILQEMKDQQIFGWWAEVGKLTSTKPLNLLVCEIISAYPTNWYSSIYGDVEILDTEIGRQLRKESPESLKKHLDISPTMCYDVLEFRVKGRK